MGKSIHGNYGERFMWRTRSYECRTSSKRGHLGVDRGLLLSSRQLFTNRRVHRSTRHFDHKRVCRGSASRRREQGNEVGKHDEATPHLARSARHPLPWERAGGKTTPGGSPLPWERAVFSAGGARTTEPLSSVSPATCQESQKPPGCSRPRRCCGSGQSWLDPGAPRPFR